MGKMREIKIYDGTRTVFVDEKLAKLYDMTGPLNAYEIENQLKTRKIRKDNVDNISDKVLNGKVKECLIEELKVIAMLHDPKKQAELFSELKL